MVKAIEKLGLPAVHVCTIIPISQTVGANRIVPAVAIPYPTGNPALDYEGELELRKEILLKSLKALGTKTYSQTVFD